MGAPRRNLRCAARAVVSACAILLIPSLLSAGTVTYTYDPVGRLSSAAYPDGTCVAYVYDLAGNRSRYIVGSVATPIANAVTQTVVQDVPTTFDPRIGDPTCLGLTVQSVGTPAHGTAAVNSGGASVTYTPSAGFLGSDAFGFTLSNGDGTASSTASINVTAPTLPPTALPGQFNGNYYIVPPQTVTPVITKSIASLVSDPYGYNLVISSLTQGTYGTVTKSGLSITYTHNTAIGGNKEQADSFTYTISDGHGLTATAIIAVNISVNTNQ